ncbi:cupin domain-containing protein [Pantoea ananatis]|uniref:cupin domain-containing protein n=1 Tax=Pantoea ananas TaxID=553 RepID=UPI0024AE1C0A|nr:cupin domain-containing protein [Pantoea ananatis]MDI6539869.1 cupin domain-containing protein [Pantoea ananatis]
MKKNKLNISTGILAIALLSSTAAHADLQPAQPLIFGHAATTRLDSSQHTAGTPAVDGVVSKVLYGDPAKGGGLYTILVQVAPHKKFTPVAHPVDGFVTVLSGNWYVGFGDKWKDKDMKKFVSGDYYTIPTNSFHYAETRDQPALVAITGYGPTSNIYPPSQKH